LSGYVLGRDAELDIDEIWEYIASDSIDAADRWLNKLFDAFEIIAQNPRIGHRRKDLTSLPVLFWTVENYLIIYRCNDGEVQIIAVTQGSRDVPEFLLREGR
jgi:plasmid stabilization system protein ParE